MSTDNSIPSPQEIASRCEFDAEPLALIEPGMSPDRAIGRLREAEHFPEAVSMIAHSLKFPLAIAWGVECVPQAQPDLAPLARDAMNAVEQWLQDPSDAKRRAAFAAGEKVGWDAPAGCLAFSVFLSGGSLAPAGVPEVLPQGPVAARALAGAITLAAIAEGGAQAPEKFSRFLDAGLMYLAKMSDRR